ncbi:MAG: Multidrug efflux transporter [Candidatus Falkowbacteria bacterium GW2011_GWC2_38_22]|uniref:Multidrug efflux transporter n=1 Tax=Candidatus Falkowbacteria bacterium GW2011_GWE1_38_31 TaxID=1618638 RepID=A0A0G0MB04_9BACT|nr:MAG: Multidrug efflux transporter [Candidatus Falkowbacteria bacterium GW2011_GWF2_38_1205]KKQ62084.1 MAG: Multidrug efflux transporter [Candidatus Falkowbacteria bacterium GW2011_GWC2_38_22]KKQ64234.1 MAG: Multidrug efflux transporter [Candidatus Falkowbacteria bacterium GW2011_GWF1_38_22]KKQ66211.1 MAG: Multidrug efflux transporter [Candidatus Falkowbacteria bacterium GW2011_GWE2_38_254]KKQ70939.1 MAG: Multidrug efflux transporter [Candidatus Falkowbacteria bacterium GW2011_GWE1_38_31]KKQ
MENNEQKSSDYLYLEKLNFRPELRKTWLNFFVSNFRVVILLIILLSAWGVYSFIELPLESDPEVKIPIAVVSTVYPGASPADIEELVTKKIETAIAGLKSVDTITSNSANSISSVTVEFDAKADLDDSLRKLRDKINDVKKDLPDDANEPLVTEISVDDSPIFTASLSGIEDGFALRKYADEIKDELERIPGVREVIISGGDEREFEIAYDPQKLTFYNLSPSDANQAVMGLNLAVPAGTFEGDKFSFPIRTDAKFYDAKSLARVPLFHSEDGAIVYLGDVASIKEQAIKKTVLSRFSTNGQASENDLTIQIVKKTGGSIVATAEEAEKKIAEMVATMPEGLKYDITLNTAEMIKDDFGRLRHDFFLTVILVFSVLFLIVGLKEAFVAGLAVPLTFFATFGVMQMIGLTLNFLSMFSLILALGLLVDDAIVVVSATKQYLRTGKFTPEEAVLLVLNDFKVVLTTTTLTTVWAFLPLLSSSGIMGEYLKSIPITVSVTLISSLIIALIINHPLAAVLERLRLTKKMLLSMSVLLFILALILIFQKTYLGFAFAFIIFVFLTKIVKWYRKEGRKKLVANFEQAEKEWCDDELIKQKLREQSSHENGDFLNRLIHGIVRFDKILPYYEKYLNKILATKKSRRNAILGVFGAFIIAIALPISGVVESEFFPAADYDYVWVNIEAPSGLNLAETDKIVKKVEERLLQYQDIINFSTIVGSGGTSGFGGGSMSSPSNKASITIKLKEKKERSMKSFAFGDVLREDLKAIKEARITVELQQAGPPSGSAFEARIVGEDLTVLNRIANDLKGTLDKIAGTVNINISLKESPADYTFSLDPARLELYNLNAAYVGSVLRMAISGTEVTTILKEGKEIKVIARFDKEKIPNLEALQNLQIINLRKQPVFLKDVAKIDLKPSVESIMRIDQERTVLLSADVAADVNPNSVVSQFQKVITSEYEMPDGYEVVFGGQNETNAESVNSILRAMVIAALLIVSTLIIQFNSFKKALIVLVTIPLALIGVFIGLAIMRINLSFPGLIGIVALFGIVVKNAIILVDKINLNIKSGIPFKDSIVDAGKSRLEAIVITSVCTIIGIIPITLSNETWMALGGAIIAGLMLSSFLTLFVIPTLFMMFVGEKERC